MADSHEPVIRPASVNDADAVFELATMMAVIFSVEAEAFGRTFAALVTASDAHLLVADVAGQVGGYLLGFEHPPASTPTGRSPGSKRSLCGSTSVAATSAPD